MKLCLIHMTWLYGRLLGNLAPAARPEECARAAESAHERTLHAIEGLAHGFDRLVVAVDRGSFRARIDKDHTERQRLPKSRAWSGYTRTIDALTAAGATILEPQLWPDGAPMVDLGGGEALPLAGELPAARDVVATVAEWWALSTKHALHAGWPVEDDCLRVVSERSSLAYLVDVPGVELVRHVADDGSFALATPAQVRVDVCDPPELAAEIAALESLPDIGPKAAHVLICGGELRGVPYDGSRSATAAALSVAEWPVGQPWPGLTAPQVASLRAAAANGCAAVMRALALHQARMDAVVDVGAALAPRRSDGLVGDQEQGERALPHHDRHDAPLRAAPRASDPLRVEEERPQGLPDVTPQAQDRAPQAPPPAPDREAPRPAEAPVAPPVPAADACPLCAMPRRYECVAGCPNEARRREALQREQRARDERRVAKLAETPREPAEHGAGVVVTRCDGAVEAAHMPGADRAPQTPAPSPPAERTPTCCPFHASGGHPDDRHGMDPASVVYRDHKPDNVKETPMTQPTETYAQIEQPYEEPRAAAPLAVRELEPAAIEPQRPREMARQRPEAPPAPPRPGPRTSDATDQLFAALARAQMNFGEVVKTRKADVRSNKGNYSYKYANLSDVMRAIDGPLRAEGLVPMQIPMGDRVYVRIVHGPSGEWIEGGLPLALPDYGSDIQRLGSALTYMRRYLLTMMLGIVADDEDDDDGAAAQGARR